MDFELTAGERVDVDFAPKNVQMEILQNCSTILSTSKFSVPLDLSLIHISEPTRH